MNRRTLAAQLTLVTTIVAALSIAVAGLTAVPLARSVAQSNAESMLTDRADVVGRLLGDADTAQRERLLRVLRDEDDASGITLRVVSVEAAQRDGLVSPTDRRWLADGQSVDDERQIGSQNVLIRLRPVGDDDVLVVTQPVGAARAAAGERSTLLRLGLSLLLGLGIGAAAGWWLARRLARPLRRASRAAQRLATGARDVRLDPDGPTEVADLADALNQLAAALDSSENRQRDFLLSVSHELRTPLTGIKGYAEALADGVVDPADVAGTGRTMLDESRRLERLVSDLLDLARFGAQDLRLDMAPIDLRDLAAEAGRVWADRSARVGVEFHLDTPGRPMVVRTDATRLRQIVDNLMENALRVTPAGSPIVLAVRDEPGTVVVEVRDGGPGLTADDLVVAFQPAALFTRYRGVRKVGSGVGLALVGVLAHRLGGVAEAGAAREGGARFAVRLPSDAAKFGP
jgi:two-component system sensor histidine kinase BaeS